MTTIDRLLEIMDRLRDPETGCPWDRKQDFSTIAPYTIEEAYEVADAIAQDDLDALKDELGDLLFQVVFHACMARERGAFDFDAVASHIAEKMIRRHPHVFGTEDIEDVTTQPTLDPMGPQVPPARARRVGLLRARRASHAGPSHGLRGQARSRQAVPSYTATVVPFCSAIDTRPGKAGIQVFWTGFRPPSPP